MDLPKLADNASKIHADDSPIYLFGSELYCGWCLESFTCPVRLKIHCHIEHLLTCSCGERYRDRETLYKHVVRSGCNLPPPFKWSHFVKLPCSEVNEACSNSIDETANGRFTGLDRNISKKRTMLKKLRQTGKESSSLNSGHEVSEKTDDFVAVESDEAVLGILPKDKVTLQNTTGDKFGHSSPSVASCNVSEKHSCKIHRIGDIQFVASCFSPSLDGKLLCCDICGDEFGEWNWKEAAVHVYSSHLSDLEQWRDACVDRNSKPQLNEDKKSADNAANEQLKQLQFAAEVAKSGNSVCNADMLVNMSDHSSINSECSIGNTSVNLHLSGHKMKYQFTVDECKMIASSLCKSFKCHNDEPEVEISFSEKVDTHISPVRSVAVPVLAKKLQTASNSKRTKTDSNDMAAVMQLKCKFCHKMYSSKSNRQRHELICCRIQRHSKSRDSTVPVRKIDGESIFYCSFCGFSDTDQQVVSEHLLKPHNNKRLQPPPGHDYIGSMKLATGSYQCTLCGLNHQCRSKMLQHLYRHSLPAAPPKDVPATHQPESTALQMKESTKQQISRFSSSYARSCPKCFHSFSSVAKYLSHRSVCRAIQHHENVQQHGNVCNYSYFFHFCKQTSAGQWKCKLCKHYSRYRGNMYRHIRVKHSKLQNADTKLCFRKEDGLWQCELCKCCFTSHDDVHKHISTKHSAELISKSVCTSKTK